MEDIEFINIYGSRSLWERIWWSLAYILTSIFGTVGNFFVIAVIATDPTLKIKNQMSNIPVLSLAFTDFIVCFFIMLPAGISFALDAPLIPISSAFCPLQTFINISCIVASVQTMVVISIDRFICIRWPLHYPQFMTQNRLSILCLFAWMLGMGCGFGSSAWSAYDYTAGVCDLNWLGDPSNFPWVLNSFILHVVNTCLIVAPLNIAIIWMSRNKRVPKFKAQGTSTENTKKTEESTINKKILKSMLIVVGAFFVFTVPMGCTRLYKVFVNDPEAFPGFLQTFFNYWQFLASIVNPMVYGILRKDFREGFIKIAKHGIRFSDFLS